MTDKHPSAWHFCSTPRNVFLSIGAAWSHPALTHHLLLIDQPAGSDLPLTAALQELPGPFTTIQTLRKGEGTWGKYRMRKAVFEQLKQQILERSPLQLFTGNDRRIEFQYAAYQLAERGEAAANIYLEDGLNSYLDIHPSHSRLRSLGDRLLEPLAKRLNYGAWYDRKGAVGCSRWITERWLTFPELLTASDFSRQPPAIALPAKYFSEQPACEHLAGLINLLVGTEPDLDGDLLLVPPHSNDIHQTYGSLENFERAVQPLLAGSESVRVKYHPNEPQAFLAHLADELPRTLPLELLLSVAAFDKIVGDTSAALLGAKWLLPDAQVFSVRNQKPGSAPLYELLGSSGIQVVDNFEDASLSSPSAT